MKTAIPLSAPSPLLSDARLREVGSAARSRRVPAYVELTKPRIATMVLITVATGFLLGTRGASHPTTFFLTLLGTGLVAAGASVWNQFIERESDGRMRRTSRRPLPSGRVGALESALFGTALTALGLAILATFANAGAAFVALATFVLYAFVYTPLKPVTTLNTAIGAVPGALPPVIGWVAATGRLGIEPIALFLVLFLWQFPHFLAIAWIHRDDYARGGHRMLPSVDPSGRITGRQAVTHALALIPVGLLPTAVGMAGTWYFAGALLLGLFYVKASVDFWLDVSDASARRLLKASILYLPAVLLLLLLNPLPA